MQMPEEEAVSEAMDIVYYFNELTNAYATELTWALVLGLAAFCLYVYRALGFQEAEREHTRLITSRPVFSIPTSLATHPGDSGFYGSYKSRYAHKEKHQGPEDRANALGYDVLRPYNQAYHNRLVPRSVWKRHYPEPESDRKHPHLHLQGGDTAWELPPIKGGHWAPHRNPALSTRTHSACSSACPTSSLRHCRPSGGSSTKTSRGLQSQDWRRSSNCSQLPYSRQQTRPVQHPVKQLQQEHKGYSKVPTPNQLQEAGRRLGRNNRIMPAATSHSVASSAKQQAKLDSRAKVLSRKESISPKPRGRHGGRPPIHHNTTSEGVPSRIQTEISGYTTQRTPDKVDSILKQTVTYQRRIAKNRSSSRSSSGSPPRQRHSRGRTLTKASSCSSTESTSTEAVGGKPISVHKKIEKGESLSERTLTYHNMLKELSAGRLENKVTRQNLLKEIRKGKHKEKNEGDKNTNEEKLKKKERDANQKRTEKDEAQPKPKAEKRQKSKEEHANKRDEDNVKEEKKGNHHGGGDRQERQEDISQKELRQGKYQKQEKNKGKNQNEPDKDSTDRADDSSCESKLDSETSESAVHSDPSKADTSKTESSNTSEQKTSEGESTINIVQQLQTKLLSHEGILDEYKTASAFLDKFAELYEVEKTRRHHSKGKQANKSFNHSHSLQKSQTSRSEACSSLKKRRKRHHNTQSKNSESTHALAKQTSECLIKTGDCLDKYDSPVLRAVQELDIQHLTNKSRSSKVDSSSSFDSEQGLRKGQGDGDTRHLVMQAAGKRLAKIRKRMEDSLQQMQQQPGMSVTTPGENKPKLKKQIEMEGNFCVKDHSLELESLSIIKTVESQSMLQARSQPTKSPRLKSPQKSPTSRSPVRQTNTAYTSTSHDYSKQDSKELSGDRAKKVNKPNFNLAEQLTVDAGKTSNSVRTADWVQNAQEYSRQQVEDKDTAESLVSISPIAAKEQIKMKSELQTRNSQALQPESPDRHVFSSPESQLLPAQVGNGDDAGSEVIMKQVEHKHFPRSGKSYNEETLDEIIERQSKRLEFLRQRKKSFQGASTLESTNNDLTGAISNQEKLGEDKQKEQWDVPPCSPTNVHQSLSMQHETETPKQLNTAGTLFTENILSPSPYQVPKPRKISGIKVFPEDFSSVFSPLSADSPAEIITASGASCATPPLPPNRALLDVTSNESLPYLSTPDCDNKPSLNPMISSLDRELLSGVERSSPIRRRLRSRRLQEKVVERQVSEPLKQKTPPPVPPKITCLSDICMKPPWQQTRDIQTSKNLLKEKRKSNEKETDSTTGVNPSSENNYHQGTGFKQSMEQSLLESSLAAGETGLIQGPPQNVEIVREKSLKPSMAASIFDPQVLQEKDRERMETERVARVSSRMGELGPEKQENPTVKNSPPVKRRSKESTVMANVRMFEMACLRNRPSSTSPHRTNLAVRRLSLSPPPSQRTHSLTSTKR